VNPPVRRWAVGCLKLIDFWNNIRKLWNTFVGNKLMLFRNGGAQLQASAPLGSGCLFTN